MKLLQRFFVVSLFLFVVNASASAQDHREESSSKTSIIGSCASYLIAQDNHYYSRQSSWELRYIVRRHMNTLSFLCAKRTMPSEVPARLRVLALLRADTYFAIGKYYFRQFNRTGKYLSSARPFLISLTKERPDYWRMAEVLFLIGETHFFEGNYGSAGNYYKKVLVKFPKSKFFNRSKIRFKQVERHSTRSFS